MEYASEGDCLARERCLDWHLLGHEMGLEKVYGINSVCIWHGARIFSVVNKNCCKLENSRSLLHPGIRRVEKS